MSTSLPPALKLILISLAAWVNRQQRDVIEDLLEENRVLRQQLGNRRLRLSDDQRRRLAIKGKLLGRKVLEEVAGIVTLETILRWYRCLIARKYDGSRGRRVGHPRIKHLEGPAQCRERLEGVLKFYHREAA